MLKRLQRLVKFLLLILSNQCGIQEVHGQKYLWIFLCRPLHHPLPDRIAQRLDPLEQLFGGIRDAVPFAACVPLAFVHSLFR